MSSTAAPAPSRKLKGVVFDMDGTLCLPETYMFREMRDALGITKGVDILDHVESLAGEDQAEARRKLDEIQRRAILKMEPQPGLAELMDFVVATKLPATILTRNFPVPVEHLRSHFLRDYPMEPILTRTFKPPKPAPDGLFYIAKSWNVKPSELLMLGDSEDDIMAGHSAGAVTVLLKNDTNDGAAVTPEPDYVISTLPDLIPILENLTS